MSSSVKQQLSALCREGLCLQTHRPQVPVEVTSEQGGGTVQGVRGLCCLCRGFKQKQGSRWSDPCLLSLGFVEKFIPWFSLKDVCLLGGIWLLLVAFDGCQPWSLTYGSPWISWRSPNSFPSERYPITSHECSELLVSHCRAKLLLLPPFLHFPLRNCLNQNQWPENVLRWSQ